MTDGDYFRAEANSNHDAVSTIHTIGAVARNVKSSILTLVSFGNKREMLCCL